MVNLVIDKEALVTKVIDKVIVIKNKENIAYPRKIMSITPITLVSKI